ncbi:putative MULE transposase domain, FHY3/FAR1 family [Helianthus annuus]|nr:putative MULE transposase domain, FHY3/FAR1 family [Helianthus annuus]KAJ0473292.1 putative MULE transposase domain, FHY3/FAR1 family [Helianthus annuus]KAJ0648874.1 putative MULE transposase domain, FHY3/FAR1 family [Helianthus annuus]
MWRTFPHVPMIDAISKTNMYNLPVVQVLGMTLTNQSFVVTHAFVSKEKEENYIRVLEMIKFMLENVWSRVSL